MNTYRKKEHYNKYKAQTSSEAQANMYQLKYIEYICTGCGCTDRILNHLNQSGRQLFITKCGECDPIGGLK